MPWLSGLDSAIDVSRHPPPEDVVLATSVDTDDRPHPMAVRQLTRPVAVLARWHSAMNRSTSHIVASPAFAPGVPSVGHGPFPDAAHAPASASARMSDGSPGCLVLGRRRRDKALCTDAHHRSEERRHQFLATSVHGNDVARAYGHRTARSNDATTGEQFLALSRRQEVRLVFDGENGRSGWHQRHRGITAGDVDHRGENAGSHEAMMLGQVIPEGQHDFHLAGRHPPKGSADRPHQGQTVKALADGGLEVRIFRIECWHRPLSSHAFNSPSAQRIGFYPSCAAHGG